MKLNLPRSLFLTGALSALVLSVHAQIVEFRATINAAQETTASVSPATGWAVLLYDVSTNTFDLTLEIEDLTNTVTASHIHEAAMGVAGPVVTNLGAEGVYEREGTTLRATFTGVTHAGTALTLLQNGAYLNFHSATYPGGEVRGQLIAQPKRLVARLDAAQERPVTMSTAYGAAIISYNPGTNKISTRLHVYNFTNTLTNSHYHEGEVGVSGPVVHGLGGAAVYTQNGTFYGALFNDETYGGDPIKLLTGGAYLNVHSNVSPPGEIRGQVVTADELDVGRLVNVSSRAFVGLGDQVLISGFIIRGEEPVRVLVTAKGPSLTAAGLVDVLPDPMLSVHDSMNRQIATNDDFGTSLGLSDLPETNFTVTNAKESALLLVLPPGEYSAVVSGVAGTTGIAITEVYEVRPATTGEVLVQNDSLRVRRKMMPIASKRENSPTGSRVALELCVAPISGASITALR